VHLLLELKVRVALDDLLLGRRAALCFRVVLVMEGLQAGVHLREILLNSVQFDSDVYVLLLPPRKFFRLTRTKKTKLIKVMPRKDKPSHAVVTLSFQAAAATAL